VAEAQLVKTDKSNLVYQAYVKLFQHLGETPPPVQIEIQLGVPLARGLGSSATAIVGGWLELSAAWSSLQTEVISDPVEGHPIMVPQC